MKKESLKFPVVRAIPVDVVLGRLGEILPEKGYYPRAEVYLATAGVMLKFRALCRVLAESDWEELSKLASLVGGYVLLAPRQKDGKDPETGIPFRMLEITITTGPVALLPQEPTKKS